MKVIDLKGLRDAVARQMLDSQISILKMLQHPNILKCFDVLKTANHCYIVTELCQSGDLASHLKQKGRFTESEAMGFFKDIIRGFKEIADKNILHRDLKPANIFISKGTCKIADFGFAKKNLTPGVRQKYNVGSPLYMSPQSLKRNIYSTKNDIWSLGIILFEMLYGKTPWDCRSEKQLIQKISKVPVSFPSTPKVSQQVKVLIRKCLQVQETSRFGVDEIVGSAAVKKIFQEEAQPKIQTLLPQVRVLSQRSQNIQRRDRSADPYNHKGSVNLSVTQRPKPIQKENKKEKEKDQDIKAAVQKINVCRLIFKLKEQLGEQSALVPELREQLISRISELKKQQHGSRVRKVIQEYYVKYTDSVSGRSCFRVQGFQEKAMRELWGQGQWCKDLLAMYLSFRRGSSEGLSQVLQKTRRSSDQELRVRLMRAGVSL